ncbi:MAG: hypothetical protein JNL34_00875 [Anaerolineae bacterium]|nr:hypothetical protein [Anaerolineae bacterium]
MMGTWRQFTHTRAAGEQPEAAHALTPGHTCQPRASQFGAQPQTTSQRGSRARLPQAFL